MADTESGAAAAPDDEDAKLLTLARAAAARTGAPAAALRDRTGRTWVATAVALPSLRLAPLQAVVAAAVSSGAEGAEAAAVVDPATAVPVGLDALRDLGGVGVGVWLAGRDGVPRTRVGT